MSPLAADIGALVMFMAGFLLVALVVGYGVIQLYDGLESEPKYRPRHRAGDEWQ